MFNTDDADLFDGDWECPHCGSDDPHNAITFPLADEFDDEVEVDVTCQSVYITPVDGGDGFAFDHDEFEVIIDHYRTATGGYADRLASEYTDPDTCPSCGQETNKFIGECVHCGHDRWVLDRDHD